MCDPVTIGSMAVSALGAKMQSDAAAQNVNNTVTARNNAYAENAAIQKNIQGQATQALTQTTDKFTPANQVSTLANAQQNRVAGATNAIAAAPTIAPTTSPSAPQIVRDAYTKAGANAMMKGQQTATAEGNLAGYGDSNLQNNLSINAGQNNLQPLVADGQHNASLLPIEMESAANNAPRESGQAGQILQALGGVGAAYAGGGGTFGSAVNKVTGAASKVSGAVGAANTGQGLYSTMGNLVKGATGQYGPGF